MTDDDDEDEDDYVELTLCDEFIRFKNSFIDPSDFKISSNTNSTSSFSCSTLLILSIVFSLIDYWLLIIFAILWFNFS